MKGSRALVVVLVLAGTLVTATSIPADSATATIAVSATVRRNCTITTSPLAFGSYDPVVANATTPLDATAAVTIACTMGTPATIGLGAGANALASQRRLANGANAHMNYQMFLDSAHATVWGNDTANHLDAGTAPSKEPRAYLVYGRIPPGQDVPIGPFSDSVVATVNF